MLCYVNILMAAKYAKSCHMTKKEHTVSTVVFHGISYTGTCTEISELKLVKGKAIPLTGCGGP
jgi:hypothetical protein